MEPYLVKKWRPRNPIVADVPASKSILNRALLLAALAEKPVSLVCGALCDDTRAMVDCLHSAGVSIRETEKGLEVCGKGLTFKGTVDVRSAGTVARFLPVLAAFRRARCSFTASEQMSHRPMQILQTLEGHGAKFTFHGEKYAFPFTMDATAFEAELFTVDTAESTQYASALLLAACSVQEQTKIFLIGPRVRGSYVNITRAVMRSFGATVRTEGALENALIVTPPKEFPDEYVVEPDVSSACYLYALSLLLGAKVTVRGVRRDTLQGDARLLDVLEQKGVRLTETELGLCADGTFVPPYNGIDIDMKDFSDQAFTAAALAMFATSPSILRGLGHIRVQESDRMRNIIENVNALGARCYSMDNDIFLEPAPVRGGLIHTYGDHRSAMGFALVGLRSGNVTIDDPKCCEKTFPGFFSLLDGLMKD